MSVDLDILCDIYAVMKEYVPQKDRQAASDNVMSVLVDCLGDVDLKEFSSIDSYTKHSFDDYVGNDSEDDDSDGYDYDDND